MKGACRMLSSSHEFDGNTGAWNRNWMNVGGGNGRRPRREIWAGAE